MESSQGLICGHFRWCGKRASELTGERDSLAMCYRRIMRREYPVNAFRAPGFCLPLRLESDSTASIH